MPVRLSACNNSKSAKRISVKFDTGDFTEVRQHSPVVINVGEQ
jgi:hypothetical protein